MKIFKAVLFFTCLSIIASFVTTTFAADSLSITHELLSVQGGGDITEATMKMTITNSGDSSLKDVLLAPTSPEIISGSLARPLSIAHISAGENLSENWISYVVGVKTFEDVSVIMAGTISFDVEAVNESGESVQFQVNSNPK